MMKWQRKPAHKAWIDQGNRVENKPIRNEYCPRDNDPRERNKASVVESLPRGTTKPAKKERWEARTIRAWDTSPELQEFVPRFVAGRTIWVQSRAKPDWTANGVLVTVTRVGDMAGPVMEGATLSWGDMLQHGIVVENK